MKTILTILIPFIIAPLTSTVGFGCSFWFRHPNDFYKLIETKGLYHMFGPNIYVTPIAYGVMFFIGIPIFLLLRKFKLDNVFLIVISGTLAGLFLSYFFRFGSSEWDWESFTFSAFFVSVTAALVLKLVKIVQH